MMNKKMVFTSAGNNTGFDEVWVDKDQTYDIFMIYYGDDDDIFEKYKSKVHFAERRKGSKFQNFSYFYKTYPHIIAEYNYFFILDDDIVISHADIESMFRISSTYDLLICQPSFTAESQISHPVTKHLDDVVLQYTNFVEVNTPLFKKEALEKLMDKYDEKLLGWGIDYLSIYVNGFELTNKYAVIHLIQCTNPKIEAKKYVRRELTLLDDFGKRADIWKEFANKHDYLSYYKPAVHDTIYLTPEKTISS